MYVLRFVAPAHSAYVNVVQNRPAHVGEVEVMAQAMHGALDTHMTVIMDGGQQLRQ